MLWYLIIYDVMQGTKTFENEHAEWAKPSPIQWQRPPKAAAEQLKQTAFGALYLGMALPAASLPLPNPNSRKI